jgi:hypothetical protein
MTYDGGNTYTYDFQGRPLTVNSTSFIYDAFGRVAEEDVPGTVTHILYQPDGSRFAIVQNGNIQNYFVPMVNGMVEVFNSSGESTFVMPTGWDRRAWPPTTTARWSTTRCTCRMEKQSRQEPRTASSPAIPRTL